LKCPGQDGPLVFIVHGDEYQCHDMFLERLIWKKLPDFLGLDQERIGVKGYRLDFPSALSDAGKFREQLLKNLGRGVRYSSTATVAEIAEVFARRAQPFIIHTLMATDEWVHGGRATITSFLEFWAHWPARGAKFRPLIFLIVKYRQYSGLGWLSWYRRIAWQRANAELRNFLDSLTRNSSPSEVVILEELRGVTQTDLEAWAHDMVVQEYCRERDLRGEVQDLCRRPGFLDPEGRIAMEVIAVELKRLLGPGGAGWEAC
jgi:hypothetical protein